MIGQPINTAKSRAEIKKTGQKCPLLGLDMDQKGLKKLLKMIKTHTKITNNIKNKN